MYERTCPECGDTFTTDRPTKVYCTRRCKERRHARDREAAKRHTAGVTPPHVRPKCRVEGCGRPHEARGYCARHYEQGRVAWKNTRRNGIPIAPMSRVNGNWQPVRCLAYPDNPGRLTLACPTCDAYTRADEHPCPTCATPHADNHNRTCPECHTTFRIDPDDLAWLIAEADRWTASWGTGTPPPPPPLPPGYPYNDDGTVAHHPYAHALAAHDNEAPGT